MGDMDNNSNKMRLSLWRIFTFSIWALVAPLTLNSFSSSLYASSKPDLIFGDPKPYKNADTAVFQNGWIHFYVVAENIGTVTARNVEIDLYKNKSQTPAPQERGEMTHVIQQIDPGERIEIDYLYRAATAGNFDVYFVIDPANEISEREEGNNVSSPINLLIDEQLTEDRLEVVSASAENDSIDTPATIGKNFGPENLVLMDNDSDFYKFQANAQDFTRITLTHDAYIAPMDIFLYDPNKNQIASSTNRGDTEEIALQLSAGGAYYLEVRHQGKNDSSYRLNLSTKRMSDLKVRVVSAPPTLIQDSTDPIALENLVGDQIDENTPKYRVDVTVEVTDTTASDDKTWRNNCDDEGFMYFNPCSEPTGLTFPPAFNVHLFVNRSTPPRVGEHGDQPPETLVKESFKTTTHHDPEGNDGTNKNNRFSDNYTSWTWNNHTQVTFHVILGPGDYTFSAIVDTDNDIPEISETNNVSQLYYRRIGDVTAVSDLFEDEDDTFPGPLLEQGDYPNQSCRDGLEYFYVEVPPGKRLAATIDYIRTGDDLILYHLGLDENDKQYVLGSANTGYNRETISYYNDTGVMQPQYFFISGKPVQYNSAGDIYWDIYHTPTYDLKIALTNELDHDVAVNSVSYTPLAPTYGATVFVQVQVENRGTYPMENITLDLFALPATRDQIESGDTAVASDLILHLEPGEKSLIDLSIPVSDVDYNLIAVLDHNNAIAETDKENNRFGPVHLSMNAADETVGSGEEEYNEDTFEIISPPYVDDTGESFDSNDMWQAAVPMEAGSYTDLVLADEDWYLFDLGPYKWFSAKVNFVPTLGDIDLLVGRTIEVPMFDDDGNPADQSGNTIPDDDTTTPQGTQTRFVVLRYAGNLGDSEIIQFYNDTDSSLPIYLAVLPLNEAFDQYSLELVSLEANANGLADLVIQSYLTVPSPATSTLYGDEQISTTVEVKNVGNWITTNSTTVELYYSSAPRQGEFGDLYQIVPVGLLPGESRYYTFDYSLPGGSYPLHLAVDPGNRVSEINEENNVVTPPYNLEIEGGSTGNIALSVSNTSIDSAAKKVSTTLTVNNTTSNTDFYLKFRLLGGPDERVVYEWEPVWFQDRYQSSTSSYNYSFYFDSYLVSGNVKLEVIADWGNRVGESNENDNSVKSAWKSYNILRANYSVHTYGDEAASPDTVMEIYRYSGPYLTAGAAVNPDDLTLIRTLDDRNGAFAADTLGLWSGVYFFRVYGYGASMGDYYIAYDRDYADWTPDAALAIDTSENDDTPQEAHLLYANEPVRKTISGWHDEDWYRFRMDSLWIEFASNIEASVLNGLEVKLYHDTGASERPLEEVLPEELTQVTLVRSGSKFYFQGQLRPGRYFVKVSGAAAAGNYGLIYNRLNFSQIGGVFAHDPDVVYEADPLEENSSTATATPLSPTVAKNANLISTVEEENDTDWFYFEADL